MTTYKMLKADDGLSPCKLGSRKRWGRRSRIFHMLDLSSASIIIKTNNLFVTLLAGQDPDRAGIMSEEEEIRRSLGQVNILTRLNGMDK